jgi:hypothetical protein
MHHLTTLVLIAIVILLVVYAFVHCPADGGVSELFDELCERNCVYAHIMRGDNYMWLKPLGHGRVNKVEFQEPAGSGPWTEYDEKWWKAHCDVIDHDPDRLVESHVKAFIGPDRIIDLRFTFEDGTVMAPTRQFYELEAAHFRRQRYCLGV